MTLSAVLIFSFLHRAFLPGQPNSSRWLFMLNTDHDPAVSGAIVDSVELSTMLYPCSPYPYTSLTPRELVDNSRKANKRSEGFDLNWWSSPTRRLRASKTQSLSRKISGRTSSATVCSTMLSLLRWPWPRRIPYAIDLLVSIHAHFLGISLTHWLVYRCVPRRSTSWRFPWRPFLYLATASVSLDDTKTRSVSELLCTVTLPTISSSTWLMSTTLVSLEGSTYLPTITYLHGTFIGYIQQQSRFSYAIFSY